MPLKFVSADISQVNTDAFVNIEAPNQKHMTGVDAVLYRKYASEELVNEREKIGPIEPGQVVATESYGLPFEYIIHTSGPEGRCTKEEAINVFTACYMNSMQNTIDLGCLSVTLPLPDMKRWGYSEDDALQWAISVIKSFMVENVIFVDLMSSSRPRNTLAPLYQEESIKDDGEDHLSLGKEYLFNDLAYSIQYHSNSEVDRNATELENEIAKHETSTFGEYLRSVIKSHGKKPSEIYNDANMTPQLFSKIAGKKGKYHTKKNQVISLALALELSHDEMDDFLMHAGFALSPDDISDISVAWYVDKGNHDIYFLNEIRNRAGLEQLVEERKDKKDKKNKDKSNGG